MGEWHMDRMEELTQAAMSGNNEEIKVLIGENPALINEFNLDGWTPLHLASYFGKEETVKLLLSLGANMKARAKNSNENMLLHAAVANKQTKVVEILLQGGADSNAKQSGGWTSLHEAALLGAEDIVKLLVENGAQIQVKKDDDQTPLDVAIENGQENVINLLKNYVNTNA